MLELLYLAIGPNIAYIFWERAMQKGDIILVASFSYVTPLLSTIISSLYLGVALGWRLGLGCALIMAGALACNLAVRRAKTSPAPQARLPEADTQQPRRPRPCPSSARSPGARSRPANPG